MLLELGPLLGRQLPRPGTGGEIVELLGRRAGTGEARREGRRLGLQPLLGAAQQSQPGAAVGADRGVREEIIAPRHG